VSDHYIAETIRSRVRAQADNRCGYCLSPQHLVLGLLEIEHLVPTALGGSDDEDNLWLACRLCNGFKGVQITGLDPETNQQVALFNPREQEWSQHFSWSDDGIRINGKTPCGRATVIAYQLNNVIAVTVRANWVAAGWHPPRQLSPPSQDLPATDESPPPSGPETQENPEDGASG
jgi:HNH endonuclease